jgi:hypothetical protein
LLSKAQREERVRTAQINIRKQYLGKLETRTDKEHKNLQGLLNYAMEIRKELEEYEDKVEMAEKIADDLSNSGNASASSLDTMLSKKLKALENTMSEVAKLLALDEMK